MLDKFLPDLDRFRVVLDVVIAVRQCQAALAGIYDDLVAVLGVRPAVKPKQARDAEIMQIRDLRLKVCRRFYRGDTLKIGLDRLGAGLFDGCLVHARRVIIADKPDGAAALCFLFSGLFENVVEHVAIALGEDTKTAPSRLRRRDLGVLDPRAVGKLKKIVTGVGRAVHPARIEAGALSEHARPKRDDHRQGESKMKFTDIHTGTPKIFIFLSIIRPERISRQPAGAARRPISFGRGPSPARRRN